MEKNSFDYKKEIFSTTSGLIMRFTNLFQNNDSFLTILSSLFFCIPAFNKVVTSIFPELEGIFMSSCYAAVISLFCICAFMRNCVSKSIYLNLFVTIFLTLFFIVTLNQEAESSMTPSLFFVYVVFPFLFLQIFSFDVDLFIKVGMATSVLGVFFVDKIFVLTYNFMEMGTAYAFLFPVICSFIYLIKIKEKNIIMSFVALLNFVYFFEILLHGSRGVIFCVFFCFFMAYLVSVKRNGEGLYLKSYKTAIISLFIFVILYLFFDNILFVDNFLQHNNIKIEAINKMARLQQAQDLTNGRLYIQKIVIRDFFDNPWFGHGIATMNYFHSNINYPHNFILQMFYDVGIVGSVPLIFFILRGVYFWFKKCNEKEYILSICLVSSSVPGAFFSGDLWKRALLWMTFGFFMLFNMKKRNE